MAMNKVVPLAMGTEVIVLPSTQEIGVDTGSAMSFVALNRRRL